MARKFVLAGARTFEDLQPGNKFNIELNRAQSLGLKHYDDLHERIPRDEVQAVRNVIEEAAGKIDPKVEVYVMGSFRRQAPTCGDIDIIFTRTTADGQNHAGFIKRLCAALKQSGLIIDDL